MAGIPNHFIHIYHKPKIGTLFMSRHKTYSYRHQIVSNGWYDTASCDIVMSQVQAEKALESWIGNRVAVYVDNPAQPIWEGLISRVTISIGGAIFTRSLDPMFNQVRGLYKITSTAGFNVTPNANDTTSQAIYGIKHGTFDAFYENNTTVNMLARLQPIRDSVIGATSYPQTSVSVGGGRPAIVSLEMKGFYHTLLWEEYYNAASAALTITQFITTILAALQNATTFFNNADYTAIQANATFGNMQRAEISAQPAWNVLQKVYGAGTTTTFWIMGITPSDLVTGTRRFYYRTINESVEYLTYTRDNLRVRNKFGGLVKPWTVVPDRSIRINDALMGWSSLADDPRVTYINRVQYDAEQQRVTWAGGDDLSMEGTMQLQRYYKMFDRFGAYPPNTYQ